MPIFKADEAAIVVIDHAVGFGTLFRSHDVGYHVNSTIALAKTALMNDIPLAVASTGRKHLVITGLMTDGCVMRTILSALRARYELSLIVDATASETTAGHGAALSRFTKLGVVSRSWLSLASELQRSCANVETLTAFREPPPCSKGRSPTGSPRAP